VAAYRDVNNLANKRDGIEYTARLINKEEAKESPRAGKAAFPRFNRYTCSAERHLSIFVNTR